MRGRASLRATSLAAAILVIAAGCVAATPRVTQSVDLLNRLVEARTYITEQAPAADEGCTVVGDVETRLYGEPGLADVRAWSDLRDAADALQAACGQQIMLAQPAQDASQALTRARTRWQQGIQRELALACDHLRQAATALGRPTPC